MRRSMVTSRADQWDPRQRVLHLCTATWIPDLRTYQPSVLALIRLESKGIAVRQVDGKWGQTERNEEMTVQQG